MEPRALSNVNGTLVPVGSSTTSASGKRSGADWGTMEDFRKISPPTTSQDDYRTTPEERREETEETEDSDHDEEDYHYPFPTTPGGKDYDFSRLDNIGMSPATPFYLSQKSKLVQQTCPPKQTRQGLFEDYCHSEEGDLGLGDGLSSERLRFKLEAARRKSLVFKPKVGSPLAR